MTRQWPTLFWWLFHFFQRRPRLSIDPELTSSSKYEPVLIRRVVHHMAFIHIQYMLQVTKTNKQNRMYWASLSILRNLNIFVFYFFLPFFHTPFHKCTFYLLLNYLVITTSLIFSHLLMWMRILWLFFLFLLHTLGELHQEAWAEKSFTGEKGDEHLPNE